MNNLEKQVRKIIDDVKERGDRAVSYYTLKYDGIKLSYSEFIVQKSEIKSAYKKVDRITLNAFNTVIKNVKRYHVGQKPKDRVLNYDGVKIKEIFKPLDSVGVYVPGGYYSYPSTVFMTVIPANVAGVKKIVVATPPGKLTPEVLVACDMCKVDRIYRVGGVQSIAALACGTNTIQKVDKIVGPGNVYVTTAKKLLFGEVGIDLLAGPSEIVVVADDSAPADFVLYDILAQLEHGMSTRGILITDSDKLLKEVRGKLRFFPPMFCFAKQDTGVRMTCPGRVSFIKIKDINKSAEIVNKIAPEHLEIITRNPGRIVKNIRNAGAVFIGRYSPVASGDYITGPSHVLPTGGTARFSSGLSVRTFMKSFAVMEYTKKGFDSISNKVIHLAGLEGLEEHAESIKVRG